MSTKPKSTKNKTTLSNQLSATPIMDSHKEFLAIQDYITATWDNFDKIDASQFFNVVWSQSMELTKNQFDRYAFSGIIDDPFEFEENNCLLNVGTDQEYPLQKLFYQALFAPGKLADLTQKDWDYEKVVKGLLSDIHTQFNQLPHLRPKGWEQLEKNYEDYEGMGTKELKKITDLFKGTQIPSTGVLSFASRTSLPHVMYDDKNQNRKPLEVLVGAIMAHAYQINETNNMERMKKEWLELLEKIRSCPNQNIEFEFKEPLNKALLFVIKKNPQAAQEAVGIQPSNHKKAKI